MSEAKRRGLQFTANQIGNAKIAFKNLIGDTSLLLGPKYTLENAFIKLRGSSIFHDYDLNKKDPFGVLPSEFTTFDILDTADFTLQGGSIGVTNVSSKFPNSSTWNPLTFSPPSPEGWSVYDYNAWSSYIPQYTASGSANTNFVIYDIYSEPSSGSSRTTYDYPVRYTGSTYIRVPFFNFAKTISLRNDSGDSSKTECHFIIPKDEFTGLKNINPYTNLPSDLGIYSHRFLVSDSLVGGLTLAGSMGVAGTSDTLGPLSYEIIETDKNGLITRPLDHYLFKINLPSSTTWTNNYWFHCFLYWGTHDTYFKTGYPTYSSGSAITHNLSDIGNNVVLHPTKSFFNRNLSNQLYFNKTSINDANIYLYNNSNTLFTYNETKYNTLTKPFRYKINQNISSSTGTTNSFSGQKSLTINELYSAIVVIKNSGNFYDEPENNLELILGQTFALEDVPEDWQDFDYYPKTPKDYKLIAKIILSFPNQKNIAYYIGDTNYNQDCSIIYIQMISDNSLKQSVSDEKLSYYFSAPIFKLVQDLRKDDYKRNINVISQKLISKFAGYDQNLIKKEDFFRDISTLTYQALHNLLKSPGSNIASSSEPYSVEFSQNALEIISDFATIPASKIFAGFASSSLFIEDIKLSTDTPFEVYLEKYSNDEFKKVIDTGNSIEKDYNFKIKFSKTTNEYVIKNLSINASKYFLTDSEYQNRLDKKLSIDGFYKKDLLSSISDFQNYSYSAVVPDLKMGTNRLIETKENQPVINGRLTEEEFEQTLPSTYTKDQIIQAKTGFGITDSFYVVDTNKPDNKFANIDELGISISNYSIDPDLYWIDNTSVLYGDQTLRNIEKAKHVKDLRNDSFVISVAGFGTVDNSINALENYKDQQIISSIGSSINEYQNLGTQKIINKKIAIRISCDVTQNIKSFRIKLKKTSDYLNQNADIKAYLYSNKNDSPDYLLATGSSILLKNISNHIKGYDFYIDYKLFKNKIYWIVLETSVLPPTYDPYVTGLIDVNDSLITGIYNSSKNEYTNFSRYLLGAELGIGSTSGSAITSWYAITSIGSSNSMVVSATGQTLSKQPYSIRYNYEIGIKESSATGSSTNLSIYSTGIGWSGYEGTASIEFYKPDENIFGGFNKNFSNTNLILPEPNRYRESANYFVDGYVTFNCSEFPESSSIYLYPRSVYLNKIEVIGTGVSNTNKISIGSTNYNEKILVGLGLSASNYISAGTSITNIFYNSTTDQYDVYLSNLITNSFTNAIVGIGTSGHRYIKRANDIYVQLNYVSNSSIATTNITLEKSPTWITKLYKKNRFTYTNLEKEISADAYHATYNLNFENYTIGDQAKYLNGYAIGDFTPKVGIGTTFEFMFISSYGLRVFVNDEDIPYINQWKSNSSIGASFEYSISNVSDPIKLEVQFNNFNSSIGQTLLGYWKIKSSSTWNDIDESFYDDVSLAPVLVSSGNVQKLSFVNVTKTQEELDTDTYGSPSSDRIIFRSQ